MSSSLAADQDTASQSAASIERTDKDGDHGLTETATLTAAAPPPPPTRADRLMAQFSSFRTELDAHQAQRERIVKLSRDVTALSKQLIFALHRIGSGRDLRAVVRDADAKLKDLRALFEKLQGEVHGADFWRYLLFLPPARASQRADSGPAAAQIRAECQPRHSRIRKPLSLPRSPDVFTSCVDF